MQMPSHGVPDKLPPLKLPAKARVQETSLRAQEELCRAIVAFFDGMRSGGAEKKLGRIPSRDDILPFFVRYAQTVFDAEARERIGKTTTMKERLRVLRLLVPHTVNPIVIRRGLWMRITKMACGLADLGVWGTRFGEFSALDFYHPRSTKLRNEIRLHAMRRKQQSWAGAAAATLKTSAQGESSADRPSSRRYQNRAAFFQKQLNQRKCSRNWFSLHYGGGDPRTVRKLWYGEHVSLRSITTAAEALSRIPGGDPVTPLDFPGD